MIGSIFSQSHWESGDETQYRLTCPYCGSHRFINNQTEEQWQAGEMSDLGDEVTCADCSRSFIITGNCYKPNSNGV